MIDFFREVMARPISRKDRMQFVMVLGAFSGIYFYLKYFKKGISFEDFKSQMYVILVILTLIISFKVFGNTVIRCWLFISAIIGKIIFNILLFVVYFVFLVPIFKITKMFTKRKTESNSNWELKAPVNSDYQSMG